MLTQDPCARYDADVERIHDEIEALEEGASDDIFQTRASPFEDPLTANVAINLDEPEGVAASASMMKHRLRTLLPIEPEVRRPPYIPLPLMDDIVEHFHLIFRQIPPDVYRLTSPERQRNRLRTFVDELCEGGIGRFSDALLRRIRPVMPEKWDLDCWIARCLLRQYVCDTLEVKYKDIEQNPTRSYFRFKNGRERIARRQRSTAMMLISIYTSRLSVRLAAWLPSELVIVQVPENARIHADFIAGADYYDRLVIPSDGVPDDVFHTCLDHVLDWMESRNWHDSLLRLREEDYRGLFWDAIDKGTEEWRHLA